jgi:hypothetical protein
MAETASSMNQITANIMSFKQLTQDTRANTNRLTLEVEKFNIAS